MSHRGTHRESETYAFHLRERMPRVGIPLRHPDPAVVLDLPAIFAACYEEGGYPYRVDYTQSPPSPPLPPGDLEWLHERLVQAGPRKDAPHPASAGA